MDIKIVDGFGRVVIPVGMRRRFKMKAGTRVTFINTEDGIEVKVIDKKYFDGLAGVLGLKGKHLKSLMERKQHTPSFPLSRGEFKRGVSFVRGI